jgi:hypothetical protein
MRTRAVLGISQMGKPPDPYYALFEVVRERILPLLKAGARPDLLHPVFGLP